MLKYGMYGKDIAHQTMEFRTYRMRKYAYMHEPTNAIDVLTRLGYDITTCYVSPEYFLYLYKEVGRDYQWYMMNYVERPDLIEYLKSNTVTTISYLGEPIGFGSIEHNKTSEDTNITYFGLTPRGIGRSIGGKFLSVITNKAFLQGKDSVWLYTTNRDHPNALPCYEKEGFKIEDVRTEFHWAPIEVFRKDEI